MPLCMSRNVQKRTLHRRVRVCYYTVEPLYKDPPEKGTASLQGTPSTPPKVNSSALLIHFRPPREDNLSIQGTNLLVPNYSLFRGSTVTWACNTVELLFHNQDTIQKSLYANWHGLKLHTILTKALSSPCRFPCHWNPPKASYDSYRSTVLCAVLPDCH